MVTNKIRAIAYLRTSSAANVGSDKDSDKRQRAAIAAFAKARGYQIVEEFYDAAVSGADPTNERSRAARSLATHVVSQDLCRLGPARLRHQ